MSDCANIIFKKFLLKIKKIKVYLVIENKFYYRVQLIFSFQTTHSVVTFIRTKKWLKIQ